MEKYAGELRDFGILTPDQSKGLERVDDMIRNITVVLDQTKQPGEPSPGVARPDKLYDDSVLRALYAQRPAFQIGQETIRDEKVVFQPLSNEQWDDLQPVGLFKAEPIVFKKNGAEFSDFDDVPTNRRKWPKTCASGRSITCKSRATPRRGQPGKP